MTFWWSCWLPTRMFKKTSSSIRIKVVVGWRGFLLINRLSSKKNCVMWAVATIYSEPPGIWPLEKHMFSLKHEKHNFASVNTFACCVGVFPQTLDNFRGNDSHYRHGNEPRWMLFRLKLVYVWTFHFVLTANVFEATPFLITELVLFSVFAFAELCSIKSRASAFPFNQALNFILWEANVV